MPLVRDKDSASPITSIEAISLSFTVGMEKLTLPAPVVGARALSELAAAFGAPAPVAALAAPIPLLPADAPEDEPDGITGMAMFLRSSIVVMLPSTTTAFCDCSISNSPNGARTAEA
ncbi:hypothetical protein D3C81_1324790 [compost metagenome]